MSIIHDIQRPGLGYWDKQAYAAGTKAADDAPLPGYALSGLLYAGNCGDRQAIMLSVPNALVRGAFDAMTVPGVELPLDAAGKLDAHIRVMTPDEVAMLGGIEAVKNDRGKPFRYSLGRLVDYEPTNWPGVNRCWSMRVHSPDLQRLRLSLGLSALPTEDDHAFHIVMAVRRRGVLGRNEKAKDTTAA